jgi:TRAP-type mannitol/chloroaromatic compound transport system permease small subunit
LPKAIRLYVRWVDAASRAVGRLAMYLIYVMIAVLLYSSISRAAFDVPLIWVVEIAQFMLAAYYFLGGGYSLLLDSHVRMDLAYSRWSPRTRAIVDVFTVFFLLGYLVLLLLGGLSSTEYALEYDQRNYSSWAPRLAPIKLIMCFGIVLMLLQAISIFFKDFARAIGRPIENEPHAASESAPETRRGAA